MTNIGSNNPFRHSFNADGDNNTFARSLPPASHPLQKSPSTTTTIMEEDESEHISQHRQLSGMTAISPSLIPPPTPPPTGPLPEPPTAYVLDSNKNKSAPSDGTGDGHILITIQSTGSSASTPPHTGNIHPNNRMSVDVSQQNCNMWPALRLAKKTEFKSKRRWIIIKVAIAAIIVVGAVAVGLGISKAVNDSKQS
ncbi:hypothetical protein BDZ91DRAFT_250842 [Kalaharituber pfeilii]|nr:hypothetical protein BDZ91DRAFT_250842 [Kalaharituber pfeilii]